MHTHGTEFHGVIGDPALPGLAEALDPAAMIRRLREAKRLYNRGRVQELRAVRLIRHKPGRRALIEYDVVVEGGASAGRVKTLIGKIRGKHSPRASYRLLKGFWDGGFSDTSPDGISVPEPVACIPELRMWLQRKVPGKPLATMLAQVEPRLLARVAEAAHKVHRAGVPPQRVHAMADELRILHERVPLVLEKWPEWRQRIERLLAGCDRLGSSVPVPEFTGIHRDFYQDQVIVDGERLYLIDFDLYCSGDVGVDIGNFLAHLTEEGLRETGDAGAYKHLGAALRERFLDLAGSGAAQSVDAYDCLTLVRHVYLSTLFPERRRLTPILLEMCEERLRPWL